MPHPPSLTGGHAACISFNIVLAPLPAEMVFAPIATMTDYSGVGSAKVRDLRRRVALAEQQLAEIESYAMSEEKDDGQWVYINAPDEDLPALERAVCERWRVSLHQLVQLQTELESGLATRRFFREVGRYARDLLPELEAARVRAIAALRQHRAFAAMAGDLDDDTGVPVMPDGSVDDHEMVKGPSVSFDW